MENNLINIKSSLQINTTTKEKQISFSQIHILKLINKCIKENKVLSMIDIIECYQIAVKKNHCIFKTTWYDKDGKRLTHYREELKEKVDIMIIYKAYLANDNSKFYASQWSYKLRNLIRTWFTNNVGILVIKGKLIAIPIIENIE